MAVTRARNSAADARVPGLNRNMYWSRRDKSISRPANTYSCSARQADGTRERESTHVYTDNNSDQSSQQHETTLDVYTIQNK